jgi:hypothetical protein
LGISGFPVDKTEIYRTTDGTQEKFAAVGSLGSGNMLVLNPRSVATVVVTAGPEQDEEGD